MLARKAGVPVPELVWSDDKAMFAEPAVVISFVDGSPLRDPDDPHDWADQLATTLNQIHDARLSKDDRAFLERIVPGIGDDGETVPQRIAAHPLGPALVSFIRSLRPSLVDVEECLIHADFWPGNTLWHDANLVAVVDWEDAAIGDPALDVAYCSSDIRYLGWNDAADRFVETYRRLSSRDLPNLSYWIAVALTRPMPDIAMWLSAFEAFGAAEVTLDLLRERHLALIEEQIGS